MDSAQRLREEYSSEMERAKYQRRALNLVLDYSEGNKPPSLISLRENDEFNDLLDETGNSSPHGFFIDQFEGYPEACRIAGLRPNKGVELGDYLDQFYEILDLYGEVPSSRELSEVGLRSLVDPPFEEFNKYSQILEKLNLEPRGNPPDNSHNNTYDTDEEKEEVIRGRIKEIHREGNIPDRFELAEDFDVGESVVERILSDIDWTDL